MVLIGYTAYHGIEPKTRTPTTASDINVHMPVATDGQGLVLYQSFLLLAFAKSKTYKAAGTLSVASYDQAGYTVVIFYQDKDSFILPQTPGAKI